MTRKVTGWNNGYNVRHESTTAPAAYLCVEYLILFFGKIDSRLVIVEAFSRVSLKDKSAWRTGQSG